MIAFSIIICFAENVLVKRLSRNKTENGFKKLNSLLPNKSHCRFIGMAKMDVQMYILLTSDTAA